MLTATAPVANINRYLVSDDILGRGAVLDCGLGEICVGEWDYRVVERVTETNRIQGEGSRRSRVD